MSSESKTADFLTVLICFCGMAVSLFLFWKDLNISFAKLSEEPIGMVYFKYNTVQRRLFEHNVWERLQKSSPVYNGDRVRTGNFSEAYTVFSDGTRLDLHENTLIQLLNDDEENSVEFLKGSVSIASGAKKAQGGGSMKIVANSKVLTLAENTSVVISAKPVATADRSLAEGTTAETSTDNLIVVTAGSVEVSEKKEEAVGLKKIIPVLQKKQDEEPKAEAVVLAGDTFVIEKPVEQESASIETPSIKKEDVTVFAPSSTYTMTRKNDEILSVPFFWTANVPLQIEFAEDNLFSPVLAVKSLPHDKSKSSVDLDFIIHEDTLYWRLSPIATDETKETQPVLASGIIFIREIETMLEKNDLQAVFGEGKADEIVAIVEKADEEIPSLQRATMLKPEPAELVKVETTSVVEEVKASSVEESMEASESIKEEVPPVVSAAPEVPAPAAPAKPVEKIPDLVNLSPVLKTPEVNATFTDDFFSGDAPEIEFMWSDVKGASSYIFTLHKGGADGEKLLEKIVKSPSFILEGDGIGLLDNGIFTWTVLAQTKSGEKSYKSLESSRKFELKLAGLGDVEIDKSTLMDAR